MGCSPVMTHATIRLPCHRLVHFPIFISSPLVDRPLSLSVSFSLFLSVSLSPLLSFCFSFSLSLSAFILAWLTALRIHPAVDMGRSVFPHSSSFFFFVLFSFFFLVFLFFFGFVERVLSPLEFLYHRNL